MYPVITISRELASGGHAIGTKLSEILGIPFIDKDFIQEVAKNTGLEIGEIEKQGEFISYLDKYFNSNFYNGLYLGDDQDKIHAAQKKIILDYAKQGPCIIVGRCADYILQKAGIPSLNIFIHADVNVRKANYIRLYGTPDQPIEKILAKQDKGRKMYYRFYTEREWGDYHNYQLNLDAGYLGEDGCVEIIVDTLKKKYGEQ